MNIGRYTVCGLLGRGGMGAVYKVRQPVTGRIAALKLLKPTDILEDLVGLEELRNRFIAEAQIMASLDHPHVAAVWDVDEADGCPFFVMEYYCLNLGMLIGESYRVEAATRRLPIDRAVDYTLQTLDALARMHHAGIIHRDVKPFNIMITGTDEVKLIDFGLSRLRGEAPPQAMRGVKVGSPFYAPPEQEADPDSVDGRADLYPVGVMLYRMLTGILPTDDEFQGHIPQASTYSVDMDAEWDAFFEKVLAANPNERFASAKEMHSVLSRLYRRWENRLSSVCRIEEESSADSLCPVMTALRREPVKVLPAAARELFGLDELWRPDCRKLGGEHLVDNENGTITDSFSGLTWQQVGSEYPMPWEDAASYVTALNDEAFAGASNWRLPTVVELATLLEEPPMLGGFCLPSLFDTSRQNLWTCDRKSYTAAWFVSAAMGFVGWQDFTCRFHVRAVRS